jgi:pimeloyl-ACP methyl ester carboxylesterase
MKGEFISMRQGYVPAEDLTNIYFESSGRGPALLFFYGLLCQRRHWKYQTEYFSPRYQAITFDYRGHNASGFPENDMNLTLEWCARDGLSVLSGLGCEKAVLIGHSMGVPVALEAARLAPEKVSALVLVCGTVTNPFATMFHGTRMDRVYKITNDLYGIAPRAVEKLWRALTKKSALSFFIASQLGFNPNLADREDVWMYIDGITKNRMETFQALLHDYTSRDGRSLADLSSIHHPTLVIAGDHDQVTPFSVQETLAKRIKSAELFRVEGGSHNAHMDLPHVVNRAIDAFLNDSRVCL